MMAGAQPWRAFRPTLHCRATLKGPGVIVGVSSSRRAAWKGAKADPRSIEVPMCEDALLPCGSIKQA